jgi:nucleoporin GLE1
MVLHQSTSRDDDGSEGEGEEEEDFVLVGYRPTRGKGKSSSLIFEQETDELSSTPIRKRGGSVVLSAPSMDDDFDLEVSKFKRLVETISPTPGIDALREEFEKNTSLQAVENAKMETEERARLRRNRVQLAAQRRMQRLEEELRMTLVEETASRDGAMKIITSFQNALSQRDASDASVSNKATEVRLNRVEKERKQNLENISQLVQDAKTEAQKQREEKEKQKKIEAEKKLEQEKRDKEIQKQKEKMKEEEEARALAEAKKREAEKVPTVYVTAEALEAEKRSLQVLHGARERVAEYSASPEAKRERRTIIQRLTIHVQQVACTKDQVVKKANDIIREFLTPATPEHIRTYAMITLSKKILAQCDVQVAKLNRYAFALAEVLARCAAHIPELSEIFVALLRDACPLAVPKYYPFLKSKYADEKEYFKICGYAPSEDDPNAFESSDSYANRISGYMLLYGAYVQVSRVIVQNHPHGIDQAWAWFARLLNKCPPNRQTAVALESFLKHAGYEFVKTYRSQGVKLLLVIAQQWIPKLENARDPDAVPVISRLRTYLNERKFEILAEGANMPQTDTSSTTI